MPEHPLRRLPFGGECELVPATARHEHLRSRLELVCSGFGILLGFE